MQIHTTEDWAWKKQVRFYMKSDDTCYVQMVDSQTSVYLWIPGMPYKQKCLIFPLEIIYFKGNLLLNEKLF